MRFAWSKEKSRLITLNAFLKLAGLFIFAFHVYIIMLTCYLLCSTLLIILFCIIIRYDISVKLINSKSNETATDSCLRSVGAHWTEWHKLFLPYPIVTRQTDVHLSLSSGDSWRITAGIKTLWLSVVALSQTTWRLLRRKKSGTLSGGSNGGSAQTSTEDMSRDRTHCNHEGELIDESSLSGQLWRKFFNLDALWSARTWGALSSYSRWLRSARYSFRGIPHSAFVARRCTLAHLLVPVPSAGLPANTASGASERHDCTTAQIRHMRSIYRVWCHLILLTPWQQCRLEVTSSCMCRCEALMVGREQTKTRHIVTDCFRQGHVVTQTY